MQNLNISIIPFDTVWENIPANLEQLEKSFTSIEHQVDLVVLPETFTTGFCMEPQKVAEKMDGSAMLFLKEKATQFQFAIAGSLIIEEAGKYYNRFVFIKADGTVSFYNKRHLFSLAGEHESYTKGNQNIQIELKGWKIRPQICYDLRFPVWSKNDSEYDLLLYVANWPKKRITHWKALITARSIENQSYALGVNRIGSDGNGLEYSGNSMLVSPMGEVMLDSEESPAIQYISLDYQKIKEFREFLSVLADGDRFQVEQ